MRHYFDPADRGASQNAAQGHVAQGGAAQNGAAQEIPASVRNAMELNPNAAQSAGEQGGEQTPSAPTWRYEVNTPEEFQKFVQLSSQGAVIFALYAPHSPSSLQMLEGVQKLVDSAAGSMICAAVDVNQAPRSCPGIRRERRARGRCRSGGPPGTDLHRPGQRRRPRRCALPGSATRGTVPAARRLRPGRSRR